jgi:hypothetical protein
MRCVSSILEPLQRQSVFDSRSRRETEAVRILGSIQSRHAVGLPTIQTDPLRVEGVRAIASSCVITAKQRLLLHKKTVNVIFLVVRLRIPAIWFSVEQPIVKVTPTFTSLATRTIAFHTAPVRRRFYRSSDVLPVARI